MAFTKIVSPGIDTTGSYTVQDLNVVGVVTASAFSGPLTGNATGLTGTPDITVGAITAASADFSGNVSIAGTLTYEDVTNIDSVGIITARQGIDVTGGSVDIGTETSGRKTLVLNSSNNGAAVILRADAATRARIEVPDGQTDLIFGVETAVTPSERLRITSGGNVGINSTIPRSKLHVASGSSGYNTGNPTGIGAGAIASIESNGTVGLQFLSGNSHNNYIYFGDTNSATTGSIQYSHGANALIFNVNGGTERLRITSAGRVGVNCTPLSQFQVKGGTNANIGLTIMGGEAAIEAFNDAGSANVPLRIRGTDIKFFSSSTERLRITSDGKIGIGTNNPGERLHLTTTSGNCKLRIDAASAASVDFYNSGTRFSDMFTDASTGNFTITNRQNADIIVRTNGTNERLRITSNGRVLISGEATLDSTSLAHPFQVRASNVADAIAIIGRTADDIGELSFYEADKSTKLGELQYRQDHVNFRCRVGDIRFASGGTSETLRIDGSGRIAQGGRTPTNHGSPNLLLWGADPTLHLSATGSTNNTSFAGIKFAVAGGSTGDYSKAGIFVQRQDSYNDLDMIFAFRSTNDAAGVAISDEKLRINSDGHVGINQTNPSRAKLHVVGPTSSQQEIVAKFRGGSGSDAEGRIALVAGYSDTANDAEGHVYLAARRNGSGNTSSFSVYCSNGGSMTERLKTTNGGEIYLNGSNGGQRVTDEYNGSVNVTNANTDAFAFRLRGSSLGSGGLLYISGTSGNVVVNVSAEILLSHSTHIVVKSMSNNYTNARIRIITDNNENGDVYIGRHNGYASGTTTLYWRFIPYGTSYVSTTAGNYSNSTHTHTTTGNSFRISGTNGGNVNASGSKNFLIDHPLVGLSTTTKLAHAAVEGPECNTMYRGKVDLVDGTATVNIDTNSRMTEGTFEVLNQNVQCFTTNETGWTAIKGSVSGNLLTITAQDNTCTDTISWMVVGERKDQDIINNISTDSEGRFIPEITDEYDPSQFPTYPEES